MPADRPGCACLQETLQQIVERRAETLRGVAYARQHDTLRADGGRERVAEALKAAPPRARAAAGSTSQAPETTSFGNAAARSTPTGTEASSGSRSRIEARTQAAARGFRRRPG